MTSFIEQLAAQRQKFLEGLDANSGDINLEIFEDFYPDRAHFIYELLQNAEDAAATTCMFSLSKQGCRFEHDGKREFSERDVRSITGIHNSTKAKEHDTIGKFGVGFKSVFVYTQTPEIYSPKFSFRIRRLVVPELIQDGKCALGHTRFEFPFNNPKKPAAHAYREIAAGLRSLAETTLLFLTNLKCIHWQIGVSENGAAKQTEHSANHIEVTKRIDSENTSSHFLRFVEPVPDLGKQHVAIAFKLALLPDKLEFDPTMSLATQMKIVAAEPGQVSVFFPAEKETSGLRFHVHGPFLTELSRASIKTNSPANDPLFRQLAHLSAKSLHSIRDLGLLGIDFLGVLPNRDDPLPDRYEVFLEMIVDEMRERAVTPTYDKSHFPARHLLQAPSSLKELLSEKDIAYLVSDAEVPPRWAVSATQRYSDVDHFLSSLGIRKWDVTEFVQRLLVIASPQKTESPDCLFLQWIGKKPSEWHQRLYALLHADLPPGPEYRRNEALSRLKSIRIVRLTDGGYSTASKCFFPSDGDADDVIFPRVDRGSYNSGKSRNQQDEARKLLVEIGVREVGTGEQIEALLKTRYTAETLSPDLADLEKFVSLVEKEPQRASMFAEFYVFKRVDGRWGRPRDVLLDSPFQDTGLSVLFSSLDLK